MATTRASSSGSTTIWRAAITSYSVVVTREEASPMMISGGAVGRVGNTSTRGIGFLPSLLESDLLGILSDGYSQKGAKYMPDILQDVVKCTPPATIIRHRGRRAPGMRP